jgi:dTDP-4-amino-4,6-dideoxygalactose transaminase
MSKLALNGGNPVRTEKFQKWPQFGEKELEALKNVLHSGIWGTLGAEVIKFSKRFAQYQGAKHAVAVTNGTVTLEVILRSLGIGRGDEVIIPPYTFNATASAVLFLGAVPVFVDIEPDTYNMDPEKIEEALTARTKAIIPVHVGGRPCDMDKIMDIAKKYNLFVVEDSAHAVGSEWNGQRVGSIGHAGSFSFQASKNLTAGEGGCITVNDTILYEKCWSIHHCGRDMHSSVWYAHPNIGTNARMTEWQAAILNTQMDSIDEQLETRMANAEYLNKRLSTIPCIEIMKEDSRVTRNAYHLFIFKYKKEKCKGLTKERFMKALNAEGIPCSSGYVSLYKQPLFFGEDIKRVTGVEVSYKELYLENAEKAGEEGIWFGQNLLLGAKRDMDEIADAIIKVYENVDELL